MENTFETQYGRLNEDQKKAVDTIDGPVLVIAGPGTGKTQVLALRIANILRQTDTDPSSILCLTFQDASVLAMKKRLQTFIGNAAFKVNIHTFHSFCSEIIKSFPHEFEFTDSVEPIKEIDKLGIFKEILVENKLTSLQQRNDILGNFKSIVGAISTLKKEFINPEKLEKLTDNYVNTLEPRELKLSERKIQKMRDLRIFYSKYLDLMKERNLIDFDDMIFKVTEAFQKNDDLVKFFQEKYLYTLVDEFQDTNSSQLELIKSIASFEGIESNVFAVGDDDQTIFKFQGANSDNFEKFLNIFPGTEIIVLHTNYRSKQEIIDAATKVITNNPARVSEYEYFKAKGLNKFFQAFEEKVSDIKYQIANAVEVHEFEHSFHEDYWISNRIKELQESGVSLNEIAVIARNNKQIVNITKFLDKFGIGYQIKRSESILDNKYIQNLIQVFGLISDPLKLKDDQLMWQILSQEFWQISPFDIFSLLNDARENKLTIYDFLMKTHLPKYEVLHTFINWMIGLQAYSMNNGFVNTFTKAIHVLNIIKFLETREDGYAEVNRISSLFQFISSRTKYDKSYSIHKFLDEIKLMFEKNISLPGDPIDIDAENKINLLTAHSSKGLEYEYVFVYQAIESKWEKARGGVDAIILPPLDIETSDIRYQISDEQPKPHVPRTTNHSESEIDERRLFYVAMTRAKKGLFLSYSKRYFDADNGELDISEKIASKFVSESELQNLINHNDLLKKHDEVAKILMTAEDPVVIPERNKEYLKNLVSKNLSLSASKLNRYDQCHYRFLLEDIFKLPVPKSISLEIGTAIHKGIEILTKSYDGDKTHASLDEIYEKAKEEFDKNIDKDAINTESYGSIDVAYEEIHRSLSAYYDYFVLNPQKPVETEMLAFSVFGDIKLRGRIDKISSVRYQISDEKNSDFGLQTSAQNPHAKYQFVITDYKTTSHTPTVTEFLGLTKSSDKGHLRQLLFYRLLLENATHFAFKKYANNLSSIRLEYINTKDGEIKVYEIPTTGVYEFKPRSNAKKTEEFNLDAEYEQLKVDLKKTFESIQNLDFERTTDRSICQTCFFKNHCGR
jgi:DNA helicase-2/ATP-dependent DNA helicase PcrA